MPSAKNFGQAVSSFSKSQKRDNPRQKNNSNASNTEDSLQAQARKRIIAARFNKMKKRESDSDYA